MLGAGRGGCNLSKAVSPRHPGFLLSGAKQTEAFAGSKQAATTWPTGDDARGADDCRGRGHCAETGPCTWSSGPRGAQGLVLFPPPRVRAQGRPDRAGLPDCVAPARGPAAGELGGRRCSRRPALAARGNRSPGRAHTHPAPPWEPSASSTAAGWPSTAAEKKTASGSSCRPSQLLPSVLPRPSPAAARGLPPASPAAARLPGAGQSPG